MKKTTMTAMAAMMVTVALMGGNVMAEGETYNIAFSSHNATGTISNLAVEHFAEQVKEKSDGRINVTFYQD